MIILPASLSLSRKLFLSSFGRVWGGALLDNPPFPAWLNAALMAIQFRILTPSKSGRKQSFDNPFFESRFWSFYFRVIWWSVIYVEFSTLSFWTFFVLFMCGINRKYINTQRKFPILTTNAEHRGGGWELSVVAVLWHFPVAVAASRSNVNLLSATCARTF